MQSRHPAKDEYRQGADGRLGSLFQGPELLPWQIDFAQSRLLLAHMDEQIYRQAAFLDQRLNSDGRLQALWTPLESLLSDPKAAATASQPPGFIFHIGHCGSTLVSRLLGHPGRVLSLREPTSLRNLADAERRLDKRDSFVTRERWQASLTLIHALLSRSYSPAQRPVIKASSNCNRLLSAVLRTDSRQRAILLYCDLETYLASVLRPQSRGALYVYAQERITDLQRFAGVHTPYLHTLTPGMLGAMNWCASMAEFMAVCAESTLQHRVLLQSFEEFLLAKHQQLRNMFAFLRIDSSEAEVQDILEAGYLRSYSKDPAIAYTPELRARDLDESRQLHRKEIDQAKGWLAGLTENTPALAGLAPFLSRR
jgi:hypothetical protein